MLHSVAIENYRGIRKLKIDELSRVNLFVGKNNSGKTSVLECIQLLSSAWPLRELANIARRRGEMLESDDSQMRNREIDVKHFFHGHRIELVPEAVVDVPRRLEFA